MNVKQKRTWFLFISFFIFCLYISLAKIEVVSPGVGVIEGSAKNIDIVTPDSGFIDYKAIKQGQSVKQGSALFSYNNIDVFFKQQSIKNKLIYLKDSRKKIELDYNLLSELLIYKEKDEFQSFPELKESYLYLNTGRFYNQYKHIVLQKHNIAKKKVLLDDSLRELENQEVILAQKQQVYLLSKAPKIEGLSNSVDLSRSRSEQINLSFKYVEFTSDLDDNINNFSSDLLEKTRELSEKLDVINKEIKEVEDEDSFLDGKKQANKITSPVDGYILSVEQNLEIGSYIGANQKILTISQRKIKYIVEGRISARYRPFIRVGGLVKVMINSPGYKHTIKGVIDTISADSFSDENKSGDKERYYKFRVQIEKENSNIFNELVGVQVNIFIPSQSVSILTYITQLINSNLYATEG
ncbi:HlyD family efflux transporter periplasmic adaptor subunit [Buttiauxella warmboldiae]|uniref:HlyD family efflux transporter periplasmic adaptor subunit n=1 Tax=Buttiauxella warmboldiae TaxID=82993 RepID=UPI00142E6578|nr:HlyD family efflux transporter periplasmic adaptor subunit [Buttiauxella warmboldiae]